MAQRTAAGHEVSGLDLQLPFSHCKLLIGSGWLHNLPKVTQQHAKHWIQTQGCRNPGIRSLFESLLYPIE